MDDPDYEKLLDQLIRLEGSKLAPYADVEGRLIVADARYAESAGVSGRTIAVLEADVRRVAGELRDQWRGFAALDAVRQRVVIHMAFSMRVTGLLAMGRMLAAIESGFWEKAAEEILISYWAKREKRRALVLAEMMHTGRDEMTAFQARRTKQ
jgi:hypothetical protein